MKTISSSKLFYMFHCCPKYTRNVVSAGSTSFDVVRGDTVFAGIVTGHLKIRVQVDTSALVWS